VFVVAAAASSDELKVCIAIMLFSATLTPKSIPCNGKMLNS
jgi:hypothetical protein